MSLFLDEKEDEDVNSNSTCAIDSKLNIAQRRTEVGGVKRTIDMMEEGEPKPVVKAEVAKEDEKLPPHALSTHPVSLT